MCNRVILLLAVSLPAAYSQTAAHAMLDAIILPTYQEGLPDPNPPFDQFQIVQTQRGQVELRFVSRADEPLKNAVDLIALLRSAAPEPMEFVIKQVPEIARHPSGKFEEYLCAVTV